MQPWSSCRMCLCVQDLNPIYPIPEYNEKYAMIVFITTGVKIDINDCLPQEMCAACINFINEIYKYRKKCEESQRILQNRLQEKQVKVESQPLKEEGTITIDITDLLSIDNSIKDYIDIGEVDEFNDFGKEDHLMPEASEDVMFQPSVQEHIVEKPMKVINSKKNGKTQKKPVRRKVKEKREKDTMREKIECEYCHKILTSKLSLRNHYKIHTGFDVVCEHCGKKFITRRLLLMHCRAKHGYEKTDKCSYCDYRASNAEQVKIHERLHTGEKPYVCKDCNAGFHRKSSYLQHIAIHLPEKTVQCDQCDSRFKSVTLMRIHKNRHRAPQYSFRCRVCDNSFARRRNVVRHLQRIHGLQPEEEHIDRLKIS